MFEFLKRKEIKNELEVNRQMLESINGQIEAANVKLSELNRQIDFANGVIEMQDMGMEFKPSYLASSKLEKQLSRKQTELAGLISNENHFVVSREYRIDGSEAKGRRFQKEYCKNLLTGLDANLRQKEKSITNENYGKTIESMTSAFQRFNQHGSMMGFQISEKYLKLRLEIVKIKLDIKNSKIQEREEIKEEKRRIKEQEALVAEAERAKRQLEEERKRWEKAFDKAITDEAREEAKQKIEQISNRVNDINERVTKYKSGWVYVIRSEAMPNWTKCGSTRRLDFTKRVYELSNAAVPFDFVVYGVAFSEDCFDLETKLHQRFDYCRVNKENKHKEFFEVEPSEVIRVMQEEFGCEVHFIAEEEE